MTDTATLFDFEHTYSRTLEDLVVAWQPDEVPAPALVVLNRELADELGLDADALDTAEGAKFLAGDAVPPGAEPVAMVYAGHQFGGYSPRLGDGRAVLLGELIDRAGVRRDLHLKGSGRTPLSRGGDGKATIGPMLREFLLAEAMHSLGVPTTRALAVAITGEDVMRNGPEPGAVLARIAASHLRVGTFEYSARAGDPEAFKRLVDYSIERHYPDVADAESPYRAFFEAVLERQAALIADWMLIGFIHGVMNTDNMTISGEGIDYGPCAFMNRYDPATVYSSIDHGGRYAFANQPRIAAWNLTRLAETLVPLISGGDDSRFDEIAAELTTVLDGFHDRFRGHWIRGMRAKLGLVGPDAAVGDNTEGGSSVDAREAEEADAEFFSEFLGLLEKGNLDYTSAFRTLAETLRDDGLSLFDPTDDAAQDWVRRWRDRVDARDVAPAQIADGMDAVNPIYIPRNHLVEQALTAATNGDMSPFEELLEVVTDPYVERDGLDRFAEPAPLEFERGYRTFCGT